MPCCVCLKFFLFYLFIFWGVKSFRSARMILILNFFLGGGKNGWLVKTIWGVENGRGEGVARDRDEWVHPQCRWMTSCLPNFLFILVPLLNYPKGFGKLQLLHPITHQRLHHKIPVICIDGLFNAVPINYIYLLIICPIQNCFDS